jgi:hypothetical protein
MSNSNKNNQKNVFTIAVIAVITAAFLLAGPTNSVFAQEAASEEYALGQI